MILVEQAIRDAKIPAGAEKDTLVMGWEERRRARHRVFTRGGREIAIALPTGTVLGEGDVVCVGPDFYVSIEAEKEDILFVPLHDGASAASLGYELGNRHLPVSVGDGWLATPYDRLVKEMLEKMHIPHERRKERFEPVRVAHHHHG